MDVIVVGGIVVAILLLVGLFLALLWVWSQTNQRMNQLADKLTESREAQQTTTESFGQIQKTLGELSKSGERMQELGKEISGLSDLLKAPKLRGGIGELFLEDLLAQMLSPEHYQTQYTFASGGRVDAVVKLQSGMVPVDAKFPLESFERLMKTEDEEQRAREKRVFMRAVKKHIDDIADKYIRPDEGTFDFALMYIPAENVYYETIIKDEELGDEKGIMAHALARRVIPVSPNSFYAYLQALALGLRGLQIEQRAQQIMAYLGTLEGEFAKFTDDFETLGRHISHAKNKYDESLNVLTRFEGRLVRARQPVGELEAEEKTLPEVK